MKQETFEEFLEREGYPEGRTQEIWEDGARRGAEWQREQQESEQIKLIKWIQDSLTTKEFYVTYDAEELLEKFKTK
jgi:hypothetical protein